MTEHLRNQMFEDADFKDVLKEIEDHVDEIGGIMASAMGKAAGIRKKIKAIKKRAKDDLAIPSAILNASLKTRKLERQLQNIAGDVPDELAEIWVDVSGQFSMFAPVEGEEAGDGETPTVAAARRRKAAADANQEAEQKEGAEALDGLVH
jgi:hypothetical protein